MMTASDARRCNLTSYRVIYGDTDKMGVVYYANYLRWFERGRSEFLRESGVPYGEIEARGIHFPVVEANCQYAKPAHYEDLIAIETRLDSVSRASLVFSYRILRTGEDTPLATGFTKHACINGAGKVLRIPGDLVQMLQQASHWPRDPQGEEA
jgi:acyl-CoA thioester hydrolase